MSRQRCQTNSELERHARRNDEAAFVEDVADWGTTTKLVRFVAQKK